MFSPLSYSHSFTNLNSPRTLSTFLPVHLPIPLNFGYSRALARINFKGAHRRIRILRQDDSGVPASAYIAHSLSLLHSLLLFYFSCNSLADRIKAHASRRYDVSHRAQRYRHRSLRTREPRLLLEPSLASASPIMRPACPEA